MAWSNGRRSAFVLGLAFAAIVGGVDTGEVQAKAKIKKAIATAAPTTALSSGSAVAPVRFFTINQVLAKHDRQSSDSRVHLASTQQAATASDGAHMLPLPTMASDEPFGLFAFRAPEGLLWVKWRQVEAAIKADLEALQECRHNVSDCRSLAVRHFASIIDDAKTRRGRDRIEVVNRRVNAAVRYVTDLAQHGVLDHWSGPLTTFTVGQGDCEDYAIAKYVALREAGIAADDVRFLLVRDRVAGDHAVLGVRHEGRWLILDNRYVILADAGELRHFTPLFALDHGGVKLFAAPYVRRIQDGREPAPAAKPEGQGAEEHGAVSADALTALRDAGPAGWAAAPLLL